MWSVYGQALAHLGGLEVIDLSRSQLHDLRVPSECSDSLVELPLEYYSAANSCEILKAYRFDAGVVDLEISSNVGRLMV